MKVFRVRVKGYKTAVEFFDKKDFDRFVDSLGDKLDNLWVEVKNA